MTKYWAAFKGAEPVLVEEDIARNMAMVEAEGDEELFFMPEDQSGGWKSADDIGLIVHEVPPPIPTQEKSKPAISEFWLYIPGMPKPSLVGPQILQKIIDSRDGVKVMPKDDRAGGWKEPEDFGFHRSKAVKPVNNVVNEDAPQVPRSASDEAGVGESPITFSGFLSMDEVHRLEKQVEIGNVDLMDQVTVLVAESHRTVNMLVKYGIRHAKFKNGKILKGSLKRVIAKTDGEED